MAKKATKRDEELRPGEVRPGVIEDPVLGVERPMHYPAALVIDDSDVTGVKTPTVTPEEFNRKPNPVDARTTDSEYIVRAPSLEEADKLQKSSRDDLHEAAQDPNQGSR
ncbi:MAG: hypothetical protein M3362_22300 [Acidobacteriota bacterium]|nr:hypothetical protein [Acidobacteriota bacterium]